MVLTLRKLAVLGGGAGALAAAGEIASRGLKVNLFELPEFGENLTQVKKLEGIKLVNEDGTEKLCRLDLITTDISRALLDVDLALIVVPCYGHETFARVCLPHATNGMPICFLGEGGGSLEFARCMRDSGLSERPIIGETNTLPYSAKIMSPGVVRVSTKKGGTIASAFPAVHNKEFIPILKQVWTSIEPAQNVLETMLVNFNAIDHAATLVLNLGRVEASSGEMLLWGEGASPGVVRCIEGVDSEILAIRRKLGFQNLTPYKEWLVRQGLLESSKPSTYDAIHSSRLAKTVFQCGPEALRHRYLTEDVPYALVCISSIGDYVDVSTPVIDSLITLASTATGTNFWKVGRTLEKLGVPRMSLEALRTFMETGEYPPR